MFVPAETKARTTGILHFGSGSGASRLDRPGPPGGMNYGRLRAIFSRWKQLYGWRQQPHSALLALFRDRYAPQSPGGLASRAGPIAAATGESKSDRTPRAPDPFADLPP